MEENKPENKKDRLEKIINEFSPIYIESGENFGKWLIELNKMGYLSTNDKTNYEDFFKKIVSEIAVIFENNSIDKRQLGTEFYEYFKNIMTQAKHYIEITDSFNEEDLSNFKYYLTHYGVGEAGEIRTQLNQKYRDGS